MNATQGVLVVEDRSRRSGDRCHSSNEISLRPRASRRVSPFLTTTRHHRSPSPTSGTVLIVTLAIVDIHSATDGLSDKSHDKRKRMFHRIVWMLTRLIARSNVVTESGVEYEYRDAEYESEEGV